MRLLFGSLLLLAGGCCSARSADLASLRDHERIWNESSVGDYRFEVSWFAHHIPFEYRGPIRVTVMSSQLKSATYVERTWVGDSDVDIGLRYAASGESERERSQPGAGVGR